MFCARPFAQFYVAENGDVHLCCPDWIAMPAGNLFAASPLEIWNGKVANRIRASILDRSFRYCIACPHLPGPSGCVVDDSWPRDPVSIERIDMLTVGYDATCNLTCSSCRSAPRGEGAKARAIQQILLSSGILKLVNIIVSSGSGDPLASPLFWDLVKALPDQDCPNLKLHLQTNGLLLTPKTWDRFGAEISRVTEISVSVDAAQEETYKANRGGDWNRLCANLEEIKRRGVQLKLNFVVQANNYKEMPEFVRLADRFGAYQVYFSILQNWDRYDRDEYVSRAVHLPGHPEHARLLDVLRDPSLQRSFRIVVAGMSNP